MATQGGRQQQQQSGSLQCGWVISRMISDNNDTSRSKISAVCHEQRFAWHAYISLFSGTAGCSSLLMQCITASTEL
jgi:hypothetical protein